MIPPSGAPLSVACQVPVLQVPGLKHLPDEPEEPVIAA